MSEIKVQNMTKEHTQSLKRGKKDKEKEAKKQDKRKKITDFFTEVSSKKSANNANKEGEATTDASSSLLQDNKKSIEKQTTSSDDAQKPSAGDSPKNGVESKHLEMSLPLKIPLFNPSIMSKLKQGLQLKSEPVKLSLASMKQGLQVKSEPVDLCSTNVNEGPQVKSEEVDLSSTNKEDKKTITEKKCSEIKSKKVKQDKTANTEEASGNKDAFTCTKCSRTFKGKVGLSKHKCKAENDNPGSTNEKAGDSFACEICSKSFKTKKNLLQHAMKHANETVSCKECGELFADEISLEEHIDFHHHSDADSIGYDRNPTEDPLEPGSGYLCGACNRKFDVEFAYLVHKRFHNM